MSYRDPFKKLLYNVMKNAVSQDEDGNWTKIYSSANRRRMNNDTTSGRFAGMNPKNSKAKVWVPRKVKITSQDIARQWNIQDGKCYWFGIPLDTNLLYPKDRSYKANHPLAPSIDRLDDNEDYTPENIVICVRLFNLGRNVFPADDFRVVVDILKRQIDIPTLPY